jgi:hypothetical protein
MNVISAPALGRPFHVGALYSGYTDEILSSGLWNPKKIDATAKSVDISSKKTKMFEFGNLSDMAEMLRMNSAAKLSALVNLTPLTGSAQIFNDDPHLGSDKAKIILKLEFR